MTSLVRALFAKTPISYASRGQGALQWPFALRNDPEAYMRAMGNVGTLFAIVNRTSNATSQVNWHLWRKAKSGKPEDRTEVTTHAFLDLWNKPNKFHTRQELVEGTQQHVDLVGEGCIVVSRNPHINLPLELWYVRPDRVAPVPDADEFIAGYIYTGPNGEQVPLETRDVLMLRMPNPLDPYRGMGPVQSIMAELDANRYSAEWNRNFFLNSAEPGGVIEVEKKLSDTDWKTMVERWREQHQGVSQAHRVAILEQGKWVDRKYTQRDMQFAELNKVSKDDIRGAFGMPKFAVGDIDDVNRATADAVDTWFARYLTVPRLERWKQMLNNDLLPLYGATAANLEVDYDNPVPEDEAAEDAERTSKATAAKTYIDAGFTAVSVVKSLDLPATLVWEKPEPPPQLAPFTGTDPAGPPAEPGTQQDAVKTAKEDVTATLARAVLALVEAGTPRADDPRGGRFPEEYGTHPGVWR